MKRVLTATGVLLMIGAMIAPSSALAGRAAAVIDFTYISTDGKGNWDYGGGISSSSSKCTSGRKITVYREAGDQDVKIGSDKAIVNFITPEPDDYVWGLQDADGENGTYYASAKKTKKCKKAVSNTQSYPEG